MFVQKYFSQIKKWKKILLLAIAVVFLVRIGFILVKSDVQKQYYNSCAYDLSSAYSVPCSNISGSFVANQNRLSSLELVFCDLPGYKSGAIELCIYSGDKLLYQTNIALDGLYDYQWKSVFVNAPLKEGNEYRFTLDSNDDCLSVPSILVVKDGYANELVSSYENNVIIDGMVAMNFGYYRVPSLIDRLITSALWVLIYAILVLFVLYIEKIISVLQTISVCLFKGINSSVVNYIWEIVLCYLILNYSGIVFQKVTAFLFYAISFIAVTDFEKKKAYCEEVFVVKWKKVILFLLYAYASFSLVGQRILIYPLTSRITVRGCLVLVCSYFWFIPVVNSVLYSFERITGKATVSKTRMNSSLLFVLIFMILSVPAAINLYANNPGISSYDTWQSMVVNAHDLMGMYDWHPAFYCIILRIIQKVWDSTYAVLAVQYFFWVYVMMEFFLYLREKGISDAVIIIAAVFCGFNFANIIHINTIWKDIPYALSLLWLFIIVAKLSIDFEKNKKKWYIYLELVASLVCTFFFRKNGMVPYVIVSIALIVFLRKNIKIIVSVIISVILIIVVKGPIYSYFQVESPGVKGMYHGLGLDILGVYYSDGEVSEDTMEMINMMTDYNNSEYSYNPTWSNQSYDVDVSPIRFIRNYLDTFIRNPITMLKAIIDREDAMWDIYAGQDTILGCVGYIGTMDGSRTWNDYYSTRTYRSIYPIMTSATEFTTDTQWIAAIVWRSGLFTLLGLLCAYWLLSRCGRGKYLIILTPIAGHILGLLLSTGWSDFRYFWPLNLMNFALILIAIVIYRQNRYKNND